MFFSQQIIKGLIYLMSIRKILNTWKNIIFLFVNIHKGLSCDILRQENENEDDKRIGDYEIFIKKIFIYVRT